MRRLLVPLLLAGVATAGCASGPAEVTDGTYRLLAVSDQAPVSGQKLTVRGSTVTVEGGPPRAMAADGQRALVCPPSGKGVVRPLDGPVTVGARQLVHPGVFGDCGTTAPRRVTLVDLDSADRNARPAFTVWAEFCVSTEPDCPGS